MIQHPLPHKLIIFDADGTLSRCTVEGQPCPNKEGEWELMPNVEMILRKFYRFRVLGSREDSTTKFWGLASNQGGVALGYFSYETAFGLLMDRARAAGLPIGMDERIVQISMCPHYPNAACFCRKPWPWQLFEISMSHGVYYRKDVLFIGDHKTDQEAAQRAGVDFLWAYEFFGWASGE